MTSVQRYQNFTKIAKMELFDPVSKVALRSGSPFIYSIFAALSLLVFVVYIQYICNEKTFASKDFGWHCTIDGWQEQCWMGLELFSFFLLGSSSIIQGNLSMQKKFHLRPTSSQYERIDHITLWLFVGWMAALNSS